MLDVVDLTVRRGAQVVVRRADLLVKHGERVAVHGPSGCGKTTLLHAIAGLLAVDTGQILLDGVDITATAANRRGIGVVFQDDQLFPHFDVAENVAYSLRVQGVARRERRRHADDWLERVGLGGFAQRTINSLSGGEAKRVALARTLAASPRVVLLDEPLTGLDASLHDRLLIDLRLLFDQLQTTVVLVTHD
ncbi:MAG: ATP-binding cassette domain-containing protein, partial [Actinobacteria bacterium]|nr:ATP-binding cassette domain-containing protein [Actinomycetota bacterium]